VVYRQRRVYRPGVSPQVVVILLQLVWYAFYKIIFLSNSRFVDSIRQNIKVLILQVHSLLYKPCVWWHATTLENIHCTGRVVACHTLEFGDGSLCNTHAPGSTFTHTFPAWSYNVNDVQTLAYSCKSASNHNRFISPYSICFAFKESSVCLPNAVISF